MTAAERQSKYRRSHPDKAKRYRETHKEYMKNYQASYRDSGKQRWCRIKSRYGITRDDFDCILIDQSGCCAVCNEPLIDDVEIDHDHQTGKVRGILCHECNTMVGFVETVATMNKSDRLSICAYLEQSGTKVS